MTGIAIAPGGRRRRVGHKLRVWAGLLACATFLFPVFWMVLSSFKMPRDIFTTPPTLFFTPTLETYISYKARNEADAIRPRPHPYEFALYYDI